MDKQKYDYFFKLQILGEYGTGKTCLLLRFTDDTFSGKHLTTIGTDFKTKVINLNNELFKLKIWDTGGQERFITLNNRLLPKSYNGCIFAYDVTDQNSFQNVRKWIRKVEAHSQTKIVKVLVGNKCDKSDRVVTEEEGKNLADEFNMNYFETSAKTNQNVNEVFYFLTQEFYKNLNIYNRRMLLTNENENLNLNFNRRIILNNENENKN